ncbi:MAG: 3-deoxy-D-manno-octulosonic acid transferase, partial [Odoribacteraceae bacterium]|nr:3-deoxy-D-manno-octulosonic acid transferase [Odoribacteraceae bacterium]
TGIFVQDEASVRLLAGIGITAVEVAGDTRFDRVREIAREYRSVERVADFRDRERLVVCGSTWPADEAMIARYILSHAEVCRWLIVPHEVGAGHVREIIDRFGGKASLYSDGACRHRVMVVDRVGLLSALYRYATIAYVGGGFGRGIHNTLEAAAYGVPVIFGPRHEKFKEAIDLIAAGGAFCARDEAMFAGIMDDLLSRPEEVAAAGERAATFVRTGAGATERILERLSPLFL